MKRAVLLLCLVTAVVACGRRDEYSTGIPGTAADPYPEPPASAAGDKPKE